MLLMTHHSQALMFVWLLCCSLFLSLSHVHARRYSSSSSSQSHRLPSSVVTSTLASSTSHWGVQLSKRRTRLVAADEWKRNQSIVAFDLLQQQQQLRGGASVDVAANEQKEEKDETKNEPNMASTQRDDSDNNDQESHPPSVMSPEPVDVVVYTAVGNKWLDLSLELTVLRSRDLAFLKQSVSKSLPGKPPKQLIQFRYQGRLLTDDHMLIDELMTELEEEGNDNDDDDDDDADNEESSKKLKLQLEMIPPVESRFALTMIQTRPLTQWTASELLDAYTTNAAAMYTHAQYLLREEEEEKEDGRMPPQDNDDSNVSVTAQLQQKAQLLREDLEATFPEKVRTMLEAQRQEAAASAAAADGSTATTTSSSTTLTAASTAPGTVQQRGQRYRVTGGGATTNLKRVIQRNLNMVRFVFDMHVIPCRIYAFHCTSHNIDVVLFSHESWFLLLFHLDSRYCHGFAPTTFCHICMLELGRHNPHCRFVIILWILRCSKCLEQILVARRSSRVDCHTSTTGQVLVETTLLCHDLSTGRFIQFVTSTATSHFKLSCPRGICRHLSHFGSSSSKASQGAGGSRCQSSK